VTDLARRLAQRIRQEGPIPFADFMEAALYDPDHGYYGAGRADEGEEDDYVTAVDFPGFADALARQVADGWGRLGEPDPLDVVEVGAGTGDLAADVIEAVAEEAPGAADALAYRAVETSPARREALADRGIPTAERLEDVDDLTGLVLGNEVLDAVPVHVVRRTPDGPRERYVGLDDDGNLVWKSGPVSSERVEAVLADSEAAAPLAEGQEAAVSPGAIDLLADAHDALDRGAALFVDYADEAPALRQPGRGAALRAFEDHEAQVDVLSDPGLRDITATVDLTPLLAWAEDHDAPHAVTTQGTFLVALGVLNAYAERGPVRGAGVKTLILPGGMGQRFKVLGVGSGLDPAKLEGFSNPFDPGLGIGP
jgi:SAM-dependent MidA family methyltransferase